jgi:hypothetical protein
LLDGPSDDDFILVIAILGLGGEFLFFHVIELGRFRIEQPGCTRTLIPSVSPLFPAVSVFAVLPFAAAFLLGVFSGVALLLLLLRLLGAVSWRELLISAPRLFWLLGRWCLSVF